MLFCSRTATRLVAALLFMATAAAAKNFTITVFQPASYTLTPTAADQMAALSSAIQQASAAGSDLLVCPELYHSGYNFNLRSLAEPRNGPSFMIVASLARKYNINILWTYAELGASPTTVYDSAVLFTRQGEPVIEYRKVNLAAGEESLLTPGDAIAPVATVDGVRIGVLICYDIFLPEPARVLARQGMDLLLVPTANGYPPWAPFGNDLTQVILPARALENNAVVVYDNWFQANTSFPDIVRFYGQSLVSPVRGQSLYTGPSDSGDLKHVRVSFESVTPGVAPGANLPAADFAGATLPACPTSPAPTPAASTGTPATAYIISIAVLAAVTTVLLVDKWRTSKAQVERPTGYGELSAN
jgi:predicted amidohydrolase